MGNPNHRSCNACCPFNNFSLCFSKDSWNLSCWLRCLRLGLSPISFSPLLSLFLLFNLQVFQNWDKAGRRADLLYISFSLFNGFFFCWFVFSRGSQALFQVERKSTKPEFSMPSGEWKRLNLRWVQFEKNALACSFFKEFSSMTLCYFLSCRIFKCLALSLSLERICSVYLQQ